MDLKMLYHFRSAWKTCKKVHSSLWAGTMNFCYAFLLLQETTVTGEDDAPGIGTGGFLKAASKASH